MAKIDWIDQQLRNWANYKIAGTSGGLGYASVDLTKVGVDQDRYKESVDPVFEGDAVKMDKAVSTLEPELRRAVEVHYCHPGGIKDQLKELCIAESTLHKRIGLAHRKLADWYRAVDDSARQEADRVRALTQANRPGPGLSGSFPP